VWKTNQGYLDFVSNQSVALPGAQSGQKDLFVEVDYLSDLDGSAGNPVHSHLGSRPAARIRRWLTWLELCRLTSFYQGRGVHTPAFFLIRLRTGGFCFDFMLKLLLLF
jgi:hypothetical protein